METKLYPLGGGEAVIEVSGRFEPKFREHFRSTAEIAVVLAAREVLVDLRNLSYIDAGGVDELRELTSNAQAFGKQVALLNPSGAVRRHLELARFERIFHAAEYH
ncbi:MAG TPA: STAS domain-containing protein [Rhodocyclaceae bacterium]